MKIKFKNIDLSNVTIIEQLEKLKEEINELAEAEDEYIKYVMCETDEEDETTLRNNILEEFCDVIQARMGLYKIVFGITADEIMEHYNKYHLEKLKNRPR